MNKFILLFIVGISTLFSAQAQCDVRMDDIYTPKGSSVVTFLMCESSASRRLSLDNYYAQAYPNATQIKTYDGFSSTRKFNCHGYAWLREEEGIDRWIGTGWPEDIQDPELVYMTDGSYIEVAQESYPGKIFWASGDHSAITTSQQGLFISKWNEYPLMRHRWNDSPYGTSNLKYYVRNPATIPSISGPSDFCGEATYTIKDESPPERPTSWSCGPNLQVQGSSTGKSVTVKATGNGPTWIKVSAFGKEDTKHLLTGTPELSTNNVYISNEGGKLIVRKLSHIYREPDIQEMLWDVYYQDGGFSSYYVYSNSLEISRISPRPYTGYYKICIRGRNGCGMGDEFTHSVYLERIYSYMVYPNPADDVVTVELQESSGTDATVKTLNTLPAQEEYEIQLWNSAQMLRSYKTSDATFQLSVSGLPAGIYFVRVIKDGKTHTQKLIKR